MKGIRPLSLLVLAGFATASAQGQDLAALAKKEKERRAKIAKPAPVYSDGKDGATPSGSVTVIQAPPSPAGETPAPPSSDNQRSVWKSRADQARAAIANEEAALKALDTQIATLRSGTAPLSAAEAQDPMRQQKVAARIKDLVAKRETQTEVLANAKKSLDALEQEARRSGIPPGWLR